MKLETAQLIQKTLQEIQRGNPSKHQDEENYHKIQLVIKTLLKERQEVDPTERPTYQNLLNDWMFLLCQNDYYQTHIFSEHSFNPEYINILYKLLQNDNRLEFKLDVAIKLGMSLLVTYYPSFPPRNSLSLTLEAKSVISHLQSLSLRTTRDTNFIRQLIKQLEELIQERLPEYPQLTEVCNSLTLESIAQHGIISSTEAKKQRFCLTSIDGNNANNFSCTGFNLNPSQPVYGPKNLDEILKYATIDPLIGIFQIPIERDKSFKVHELFGEDLRALIQKRIQASVVFIFNHPALPYPFKDKTCWEQRFDAPLTPDKLQTILVPIEWFSIVKKCFPEVLLIIVKNMTITQKLSSAVRECLPSITSEPYSLSVPDYVGGLQRYIQKFKPERFYTHITRLSVEHDMKFLFSARQFSINELAPEAKRAIFTRKFSQRHELKRHHSAEFLTAFNQFKTYELTNSELVQHGNLTGMPIQRRHSIPS